MSVAVISGGAGGLGRALGAALQARGWQVVALDRDIAGLEPGAALWPVTCDLTDRVQIARACAAVLAEHPRIDLVIHAAGLTHIGPFEHLTDAALRRLFEVNFFAAVDLTRHLQGAVRTARGTHLAISSVAGFAPLHHRTAYAASKHALEGFFGSLRSEEAAQEVRVAIAAPSFVATNTGNAGRTGDGLTRPGSAGDGVDPMTPEAAATAILRGLDRGAERIAVGRVARASWLVNRASPALYQRLMRRSIKGG
ncbi:MAG TPA: short-chain dehydrogenase [Rhodobacteraceae bacterium]|nr:short-chain dehydrogenase [Paracoccaceae bacterium]